MRKPICHAYLPLGLLVVVFTNLSKFDCETTLNLFPALISTEQ